MASTSWIRQSCMDLTFSPEEAMLLETAGKLAARLDSRIEQADERGWRRIQEAGWCGLRERDAVGQPAASALHLGLIAETFGATLVGQPFLGATLGSELLALAGADGSMLAEAFAGDRVIVPLLDRQLSGLARTDGSTGSAEWIAWDAAVATEGAHLASRADGDLDAVLVDLGSTDVVHGADGSRALRRLSAGHIGGTAVGTVSSDDCDRWLAFALSLVACELVGVMSAALRLCVDHAIGRFQFGRPIASFQAVQHMCAEQAVTIEAARSISYLAAWGVDELPTAEALLGARVAKVYAGQAALRVTETGIQVHGGMGMTWECDAHRFLRRALLGGESFGGDTAHLTQIARSRIGPSG